MIDALPTYVGSIIPLTHLGLRFQKGLYHSHRYSNLNAQFSACNTWNSSQPVRATYKLGTGQPLGVGASVRDHQNLSLQPSSIQQLNTTGRVAFRSGSLLLTCTPTNAYLGLGAVSSISNCDVIMTAQFFYFSQIELKQCFREIF